MKCGGDAPKVTRKPVDLGPVDAITGPRVKTPAERKCVAKFNGSIKNLGSELRNKHLICRGAALNHLWRKGDVKTLAATLRSDIADVREISFQYLQDIMSNNPSRKQVGALVQALSHNKHNNLVRVKIASALSMHLKVKRISRLHKKLASILEKVLNPNSKELDESKMLALKSLGKLRAKDTLPKILQTIKGNENVHVRMAAVDACIQINPRNSERIIRALIEVGNSMKHKIDLKAQDTTKKIAERTIAAIYKEAMSTYTVPGVDSAIGYAVLEAVDGLMEDPDVLLHASIIRALGHFRASTEEAMDLIRHAMQSPIWSLRRAAASALARVDHADAASLLKKAVFSEGEKSAYGYLHLITKRVRVLSKAYREAVSLADRADMLNVDHYKRKFRSGRSSRAERLRWIANLKELGSKRALMLLLRVSRNEKELAEVRKAAKEVLDKMYKMPLRGLG